MAAIPLILLLLFSPLPAAADDFSSSSLEENTAALSPEDRLEDNWRLPSQPPPEGGRGLREIVFSVAGRTVTVKNGGVLALHPDTPFRVFRMRSGSWFDFNLHAELAGLPGVNLVDQAHTLAALLGEDIYQREYLDVLVLGSDGLLGGVRIMVRMLPIDWLRRAGSSAGLEDRVFFLHKAYELAPDDRLLVLNLLDGLRRLGRLEQALSVLRRYPGADAAILAQQGYIYQALGRLNEAIDAFRAGLALTPGDWEMSLALVALYESKEQWPEAAALLNELINLHTAVQAGEAVNGPQIQEEAEKELAALLLRLARAYARIPEKINQSLTVYEQYLLIASADHLLWLEIAQLRASAGQEEASLAARRQALNAAPANRDMIMQLQSALQRQGKAGEAALVLREGIRQLPKEDMLWLELIKVCRELGDNGGLIETYRQYTGLHPEEHEAHYNLAQLLQADGQTAQAIASMETALKLRPDYPDYLLELMRMQAGGGQSEAALQTAARLLGLDFQPAGLWQELYALFGQSRPRELARLLDSAGSDSPPKLYEVRALLALNQNLAQEAARILEQGAENYPEDLRLLYLLGGIYEGLNRDAAALPVYEKILRIDPEYDDVKQRYLQLKIRILDK